MAKNCLLVAILGFGLAACSGGGTPTAGTGGITPEPGGGVARVNRRSRLRKQ